MVFEDQVQVHIKSIFALVYGILYIESNALIYPAKPTFLPASPKAKAGLGVGSLRPSVRPSVPKSCHRKSPETTDPIIMKLGM